MPTPATAMALLASVLTDIDVSDEQSVDDFYVRVFPAFSEAIREKIFDWLSTLDHEPSPDDLQAFSESLRKRHDFALRRSTIVSGPDAEPYDRAEYRHDPTGSIASSI